MTTAVKETVYITLAQLTAILDKIICSFVTLSLDKLADVKMIKGTRVPVDANGNVVAEDSADLVEWKATKEPNPYFGQGIRVVSILKNASPAGADYETCCNNLRLRMDKEADFEAQAHKWFRYDPNSRVLGHNKAYNKAILAGDMEHVSTHIALPMTTWAPSIWLDAMGNIIDAPHYNKYQKTTSKVDEDKVPYNNVTVANMIELNAEGKCYVIVKTAELAREMQSAEDKRRAKEAGEETEA